MTAVGAYFFFDQAGVVQLRHEGSNFYYYITPGNGTRLASSLQPIPHHVSLCDCDLAASFRIFAVDRDVYRQVSYVQPAAKKQISSGPWGSSDEMRANDASSNCPSTKPLAPDSGSFRE